MRPERKQKAEYGELERLSNHIVLGLVPCFCATLTPSCTHLLCLLLAAVWNYLTLLLYFDNDLYSIQWGRCTPLAQDFRVTPYLERKSLGLYDTYQFVVVLYFARVYK